MGIYIIVIGALTMLIGNLVYMHDLMAKKHNELIYEKITSQLGTIVADYKHYSFDELEISDNITIVPLNGFYLKSNMTYTGGVDK